MKETGPEIALGSDHAGHALKEKIKAHLQAKGYQIRDYGTNSTDSADYPDHAHPLAKAVASGQPNRGVVICGSGNGVAITANKHKGVRAALCWTPEIARLARQHNDANVLALPARFVQENEAMQILEAFLNTPFDGGRHQQRVKKINP